MCCCARPWGPGTFEERLGIVVGRFLNCQTKPGIIWDPFDMYGPRRALRDHLEVHGFVKPGERELLHWSTSVDEALALCR